MTYADQCKGCACFTDDSHGGLVNGLCLDCRNPEVEDSQQGETVPGSFGDGTPDAETRATMTPEQWEQFDLRR